MGSFYTKGLTGNPGGTRSQGNFIVSYNGVFKGKTISQQNNNSSHLTEAF